MRKVVLFFVFIALSVKVFPVITTDGSVIRGKVQDNNGNPLTGASVKIEKTFLGSLTNEEGYFSISGIKDGAYQLTASFTGYIQQTIEINLAGEAVVNFSLEEQAYLTDEVMVSATRAGEHSPLAFSTLGSDMIHQQNIGQDMPYLLGLTPSLVETSESGNGIGYTALRIRGTDGNRINVTIDGIPLNDPESQQVFWVDLPDIAASAENIQIQRGAGTSSNGAGAFGATISVQTLNPENEPFAEVNSSMGSFRTLKNSVSAGTGLLGGKFALQMRYSDIKSDGYVNRTGSKHKSFMISNLYRSEKSLLKANIILGQEHTGIGWWGVPKDSLATNRKYNPSGEYIDAAGNLNYYGNESDNYNQNHFQLIYSLKINDFLTLNSALHYTIGKGYYEEYGQNQLFSDYGLPDLTIGSDLITTTDLIRQKWMSNDFYGGVYSLKYQRGKIDAALGGGLNLYLGDHFGKLIWMREAGNTEKDYRWYFNNSEKGEFSIYGKLNYAISTKTSLFGDLQYRGIRYNMKGADDDLKQIAELHRFTFFNPKAGIFHSISANQDAYLSFSVANREPTRSDYKEAAGDPAATPKPETLYDTELGYKLRTGKSSLGINFYGMFYKDQLVPTGQLSNVGYSIMTNVAKSYRIGLELSAALKLTSQLDWNMNLSLSKNRIKDFVEYFTDYNTTDWSSQYLSKNHGNVDIAYSPSKLFTSDLAFRPGTKINIHLISKYVGSQYFDNTMSNNRRIDSYFVNNLLLGWSPLTKNLKELDLQLMVNNILNVRYENNAYGGNWYEDGVEKTWSYFFPQAGTNVMLRIGLRF